MSDVADAVNEAIENARESRLNSAIALLVALTATFMALMGVKAGNLGQAMAAAQANVIDTWSYYQAKSTKQNLAEATLDELKAIRDVSPNATPEVRAALDKRIADYGANAKRYEREKNEIKTQAEGYQKEYERLNVHDDQFDLSDAALSVAIALFGITALTQKRWLLVFAIVFMAFGVFFGLAAAMRWDIHPELLTGLLG